MIQVGYSQGNITDETHRYSQRISLTPSSYFRRKLDCNYPSSFGSGSEFLPGYGPGLEVFHQDGLGVNDTITDVFYGDEFWLGLSSKISPDIQIFISYKRKGNFLFRSPSFGGQVITAGVAFGLLG